MNREKEARTSKALWIPCFWFFICASRNVSEWIHYSGDAPNDRYLEGNSLDRTILTLALALAVLVLVQRGSKVLVLLRANIPILLFFLYCGISSIWSDFPDVSFKRWFRAVGDLIMIAVVLTDPNWYQAIKRFITRVGFLVIPLSALFIRYFPELGRSYSRSGQASWTGVGTDKNALGIICAVFGLAAVYYFLEAKRSNPLDGHTSPRAGYVIIVPLAFYLLWQSNSATAFACFGLAGAVMILTNFFDWARKPVFLHLLVALALLVPFSSMFLGIGSGLVENLGRNTTFTGRTAIWQAAIPMVSNPLVGAGFESFWLGRRLTNMENAVHQSVNQAHNGYIEIYLNLGWVGLILLGILLVTSYKRITAAAQKQTPLAGLRLAYLVVAIAYDFTEGGFKMMHPVWISLLTAMAVSAVIPLDVDKADEKANKRDGGNSADDKIRKFKNRQAKATLGCQPVS